MNTSYLTRARRHFCHPGATRSQQRHNASSWVRMIRLLGDKWVMRKQLGRTS